MLTDGVDITYKEDGRQKHSKVWLVDRNEIGNNEFLAASVLDVEYASEHYARIGADALAGLENELHVLIFQ